MDNVRGAGRRKAAVAALSAWLGASLLAGCSAENQPVAHAGPAPSPQETPRQHPTVERVIPEMKLTTEGHRSSRKVVAAGWADAPYNYGPTVMRIGGTNRMWWCSQYGKAKPAGDDILYGSSKSLAGAFRTRAGKGMPRAVFSGDRRGWDAKHTCDPSVIKVGNTYYMYYTGARSDDHDNGNAIGLATSKDGVKWRRANGGKPIVRPAGDRKRDNVYGAGQPSVVHVAGWFYLMFTDTTGAAAGWNGAGQFLLRSRRATFDTGVQALTPNGFKPVADTGQERTSSLVDAFSADLMWVDVLDAFAIAHQTHSGTTITFWDRNFTVNPHRPVTIKGRWKEGPGLVRTPAGHAPISVADPCGTVPLDVIRATTNRRAPTDLRHYGMDLRGAHGCAERKDALRLLNGYAMPSPERTMDLITGGKVVRVDRRSVAELLADRALDVRPAHLPELPVQARLRAGAPVLSSPNHPAAILLDDERVWPLTDGSAIAGLKRYNQSPARTVSDGKWTSHQVGGRL